MLRFRDGDRAAYETLVRRHLAFVHRHARRYLNDDAGAEDVAQEVFLRLYRSADLFREPTNFPGWLATITTRLALNELRTRARKRWLTRTSLDRDHALEEWRPGSTETFGVEHATLAAERAEIVRGAISRLPERQRLALTLQRFEGWSLDRIGETLDLGIPAVKSLLHRARGALEEMLRPHFSPPTERSSTDEG